MRNLNEPPAPPEKVLDANIGGRLVHVNVMETIEVRYVEDDGLPPSKRTDAVMVRYRGVSLPLNYVFWPHEAYSRYCFRLFSALKALGGLLTRFL